MKTLKIILLTVIFFTSSNYITAQTIKSNQSEVKFEIHTVGIFNVKGTFSGMEGNFNFSETNLDNSNFDICIDAQSVDTDNDKRDEHLRSADFFDVETHPNICYKSSSVSKTNDGYQTTGNMTIHGVTKTVTIPFTFKNNTFEGELEINRFDYNIGEDYGTFRAGETAEVTIICKVE